MWAEPLRQTFSRMEDLSEMEEAIVALPEVGECVVGDKRK